MATAGLRQILAVIAAAVCVGACGPSAIVDRRVGANGGNVDPEKPRPPIGLPSTPAPTPPNNQPTGPIDSGNPDGFACKENQDCRSMHCVDGLCCQSACEGACRSCDQPGSLGRCVLVAAGQDPDDECAESPVSSCGLDGACDGNGACRRFPSGTVCAAGGCQVATETAPSLCDGNGTCVPGIVKNCAPAVCVGDACAPPCAMDTDCPMGRWCDKGTCRSQREQGQPCDRSAQCGTGFCTDGVCCNMECKDACYACALDGSVGMCKAVPDGRDPDAECPVQAIGTCGNGGGCNGRGACRKHPMGTFCGYGMCTNNTQYGNSICDGMGMCRRGPGRSCGAYACNGNLICWHACSSDAQCAPGRHCNVHTCQ